MTELCALTKQQTLAWSPNFIRAAKLLHENAAPPLGEVYGFHIIFSVKLLRAPPSARFGSAMATITWCV